MGTSAADLPQTRRQPASVVDPSCTERRGGHGSTASLEAGNRHAEWRAGDVVQADLGEEVDRFRIATVLAADPDLEIFVRGPPFLDGDPD
jgi:hypothetical protein